MLVRLSPILEMLDRILLIHWAGITKGVTLVLTQMKVRFRTPLTPLTSSGTLESDAGASAPTSHVGNAGSNPAYS